MTNLFVLEILPLGERCNVPLGESLHCWRERLRRHKDSLGDSPPAGFEDFENPGQRRFIPDWIAEASPLFTKTFVIFLEKI